MELANIFRWYIDEYCKHHKLTSQQYKVVRAIQQCRTAALGGHLEQCDHCGTVIPLYNSCRNRHCPKCQSIAKIKWLKDRQNELLPVEYFHAVFTLPHELNHLAMYNQTLFYNLLFKSAWTAVSTLGKDPKRLDGEMGMLSILHTWGQNLSQHIHLHCVIPGGALQQVRTNNKDKWQSCKPGFLFPVKALSKIFKGTYREFITTVLKIRDFALLNNMLRGFQLYTLRPLNLDRF